MNRFKWYRKLKGGIWYYNRYELPEGSFPDVKFSWSRSSDNYIFREDYRTIKQITNEKIK